MEDASVQKPIAQSKRNMDKKSILTNEEMDALLAPFYINLPPRPNIKITIAGGFEIATHSKNKPNKLQRWLLKKLLATEVVDLYSGSE